MTEGMLLLAGGGAGAASLPLLDPLLWGRPAAMA